MLLCFQCTTLTKAQLDWLIRHRGYPDYQTVLELAVQNLHALETGETETPMPLTEESNVNSKAGTFSVATMQTETGLETMLPSVVGEPAIEQKNTPRSTSKVKRDVPHLFKLMNTYVEAWKAALDAAPLDAPATVTVDRWLLGVCNKHLPAKAACRAVANMLEEHPAGLNEEMIARIADEAAVFGSQLASLDSQLGLGRDEALRTAFPDEKEKSRARFAGLFVGSFNKAGELNGMLADLGFATRGRGERLVLTRQGWDFALMQNPVLDEPWPPGNRFSDVERQFLLEHFTKRVPAEAFAYRYVLRAVADGIDTPTILDEALQDLVPKREGRPYQAAFLSAQRSGVISRMADLGLVLRVRDGVKVTYMVTPNGHAFLTSQS